MKGEKQATARSGAESASPNSPRKPVAPNRRSLIYLYSRLPFLLRRVEQLLASVHASLANGGPTLAQTHFLTILERVGTLSQTDLARLVGSDTSTTSLVLGNLLERGDIERTGDPADQRRKLVAISASGKHALAVAAPILEETQRLLLEPLGNEGATFTDLLGKVATTSTGGPTWLGASGETSAPDAAALEALFTSPTFLIRRAMQVMDAVASDALGPFKATARQFTAALLIFTHPGIGEADLARYAGFETSNVSFLVRLLARKGLIERVTSLAGKRSGYRITPTGWEFLKLSGPAMVRAEQKMLESLTAPDIDTLRKLLARIVSSAVGGRYSTLPLFQNLIADSLWPIKAAEPDFASIATVPRDHGADRRSNRDGPEAIPSISHERHGVLQLLKWAELAVRSEIEELLVPLSITPHQLLIMGVLADDAGLSSADLARLMGVTPQSILALLQPLQNRRLIARRADPANGRRLQVTITTAGRRLLEAGSKAMMPMEERLLGSLSAAEREKLRHNLLLLLSRAGHGEL